MLLWQDTAVRRFLDGVAYWVVVTGNTDLETAGAERIQSIRIVDAGTIQPETDSDGRVTYTYTGSGPKGRVIAFTDYGATSASKLLKDMLQSERFSMAGRASSEESAMRIQWKLQSKDGRVMTPEGQKKLGKKLNDLYSKDDKATVLTIGTEDSFEAIERKPDVSMDQVLKTTRALVSMISNVPTPLLGEADNSKYANLEGYRAFLYEMGVLPQLKRWQSILSAALCGPGEVARFNLDEIKGMYAQHKTEAETLRLKTMAVKDLQAAGMSLEDALEVADLEPNEPV